MSNCYDKATTYEILLDLGLIPEVVDADEERPAEIWPRKHGAKHR